MKRAISIFLIFLSIHQLYSQKHYAQVYKPAPIEESAAKKLFNVKMYYEALRVVVPLLPQNSTSVELQYIYAVSLLETSGNKKEALAPLEYVNSQPNPPTEVEYYLGLALMHNHRFDEAIEQFKKYQERGSYLGGFKDAEKKIFWCESAKEMIKNEIEVSFENLGEDINSLGEDYHPVCNPDETLILFTSRREGTTGGYYCLDGSITPDIYMLHYKNGKYQKLKSYGKPNSFAIEEIAGISENAEYILFHLDDETSLSDLHYSTMGKRSYNKPEPFNGNIVTIDKETSGVLSNDGQMLIYSSDRNGGKGEFDLWRSKKLPNGNWGEPQNISELNTIYNEKNPFLTNNGKTLYFSSDGLPGCGGYDLFKSEYDDIHEIWGEPTNLGFGLNTTDDEMSICFTKSMSNAYISAWKEDSYGGLDIYRATFKNEEQPKTLVLCKILNPDSTIAHKKVDLSIYNLHNQLIGKYKTVESKGSFVMILPPGEYELVFNQKGYEIFSETVVINDKADYKAILQKSFIIREIK